MTASTKYITIKTCPVCGGEHIHKTMECTDYYVSKEGFDLYECKSCGFIFTQDFPAEECIGPYYDTPDYISHSDTKKGVVNMLYHRVRQYMLGRKARLVCKHSGMRKHGHLLDIGAGTGYFAATMVSRGWDVTAIEKSESARDLAKRTFNMDMLPAEALNGNLTQGTYDAITLWHVMEHLEHLDETWELLHSLLKDSGALVIAVPNAASYDAQKYGELWAAHDVPRHLWHFTPATMRRLAEKHGFKQEKCYAMPFDAFYISILSEKYSGNSMPFIRGIFTGVCAWFASLFNREKSSSVIYIFRKAK